MACMEGYIITLITFLHFPFSNVSSRCLHNWTKNCINYNSFDFLRYGFSMVSPWHFYQSTKSHTNCICLAFVQCSMTPVTPETLTREANRIHIQQECLERPDAALPCACLFCGLRFPSKASLRVHLSRWCKEKWFSHFFLCFLLMKYMTLYWYSAAVQHLFLGAISNFATGFQKVNVSQNKMSKGCLYIPIY